MDPLRSRLANPSNQYRTLPFWSWNDKLDPETLRAQIRSMKDAGVGGYFMHARAGLQTEYMGDQWREAISLCLEEGLALGLDSWGYDENGWPSGSADGVVPSRGDAYHSRWIEFEARERGEVPENWGDDPSVLGLWGHDTTNRVGPWDPDNRAQTRVYRICQRTNPFYSDLLNPEVVRAFIEMTHERYREFAGASFGRGFSGFFTDEPQFAKGQMPWTAALPEQFRLATGQNLMDQLPALFVECEGYEPVRYRYWALVNQLMVHSFAKQIYDYCEPQGLKLTGHVMAENSLEYQMQATAGAMPFYEFMHIPGMDWLGRKIGSPIIPKQVSSVAQQLGRAAITETFGLCGWNVSLEELKWIAEWQFVNGITLISQHLQSYSLRGLRKRDYPPSLFHHQPWWPEYRHFNDYFARLSLLLSETAPVVRLLVIHPIKSAWIAYNRGDNDGLADLDRDFLWLTETLSGLQFDHHYGDETILASHGRVEGRNLVVGRQRYQAVLLPSLVGLDGSTIALLLAFIQGGGALASVGAFPRLCEGRPDARLEAVRATSRTIPARRQDLKGWLMTNVGTDITIRHQGRDLEAIRCTQRSHAEAQLFFLTNQDATQGYRTEVALRGGVTVTRYRAEDDTYHRLETRVGDGPLQTLVDLSFEPMQSYLLWTEPGAEPLDVPEAPARVPGSVPVVLGDQWDVVDSDANVLTLDRCALSIEGGLWQEGVPTIQLMDLLLALGRPCEVALRFDFWLECPPESLGEIFLLLETARDFEVMVNDRPIPYRNNGWWKDVAFERVEVRSALRSGANSILLRRRFHQPKKVYDVLFGDNVFESEKNKLTYEVEFESLSLVGDFDVLSRSPFVSGDRDTVFTDGPFVIAPRRRTLRSGNFVEQGLCFFSGRIRVGQSLWVDERALRRILDLGRPKAIVTKVFVNGTLATTLLWAPFSIDITEWLHPGVNRIELELFGSNRNMLGPHHHYTGECTNVGPASFTDKPGWNDERGVVEVWRDRYCFVSFGT